MNPYYVFINSSVRSVHTSSLTAYPGVMNTFRQKVKLCIKVRGVEVGDILVE